VPNAPPTVLGPRRRGPRRDRSAEGPNVDLSDIDPLAPRYKEWAERAAQMKTQETQRVETLPFGGDRLGRDVLSKAIKGTEISVFVGVLAALLATLIGTCSAPGRLLRRQVDDFLEWLYNVFTAVPDILLIFAFAAVFGRGIGTVVLILGLTGWAGVYRQVRAEFIKHRGREYVRAAEAIGASAGSRMFRHILPNVSHVILVRLSLLVVGFIKAEVILSYLGLGVPVDQVSWGTMLSEAQSELILGYWWQLAAATASWRCSSPRSRDGRALARRARSKLRGWSETCFARHSRPEGRFRMGRARQAGRRPKGVSFDIPRTPPSPGRRSGRARASRRCRS
jgi:peptide/nickel transport system permease protein